MIKNYLKIAWRNLRKSKAYSAINILGLSIGMAVAILIGLWIWDELTFNEYHTNHAQLAQVMTTQTFNGHTGTGEAVAMPLGNELRTKYGSDFKAVSMASWNFGHILAVGDKKINSEGMWVEAVFPSMFSLKMIKGDKNSLKDPSSILLSASIAKTLFGNDDAMNKMVKLDNKDSYKVTGVYEDLPRNTTLYTTKILLPWEKYITTEDWMKNAMTQWGNHSWQAFVQVNDHVDIAKTTQKIKNASMIHLKEAEDGKEELVLQPMDKWRLYNKFENGKVVGGRIEFVWLFGVIGVFVLLLACINFMNLATARSEKRAKEVGIRKTVGSLRQQLIGQFLSESILVAFIAFIVSIGLVQLMLSFFNSIADKEMSIPWSNVWFWVLTIGFTFFTGLISGSYPAFYLSGFEPIKVLKGTFRVGRFASLPRKVLVVIQFTVSIALIIGTIIVFRQIQFAKDRPVGYTREGLITIDMSTPDIYGHYDAIRGDLIATGAVENMAQSSSPVTNVWSNQIGFNWEGKDPNSLPLFGIVATTYDFGKTIGWQIKEGRDFSKDFATDSTALIFNESAVKLTGLKNIVGKNIKWNDKNYNVVGVIKDMVMESPYTPVKPTIFTLNMDWASVITVRIKPTVPAREALAKIETVFKKYNPGAPFDYKFTDEEYAKKFEDEERIGNIATFFAILAIFISCLGLFGLASFVAEQRTKEIGVRKVLGASVFNLWGMLSKDFVVLVVISCFIAIPIAWYYLYEWLQRYEYRTPIAWWVFAAAAMGALLITLLTVSFQAIKAALANPVKSLRTE
ncbi:FtsX-like permease family protein [Panacibacter ginsenosidivorans]|uniref:FtsX-like permease family protein n=1 Tax=Panacibacter ginsenosidivorans TaxID=1813871 RepID=A0A5B8V3H7_9BACT|nr:ABC transporter permease [Panacibacter ginsenosidivorans]QEC65980.1 FtsX-like permease family protein [Panacibacter ginsenosidivorans]